jgi:hypothetical protein
MYASNGIEIGVQLWRLEVFCLDGGQVPGILNGDTDKDGALQGRPEQV